MTFTKKQQKSISFELPHQQVIFVPSTQGIHKQRPISDKQLRNRTNEVERFASNKYGGFTEVPAVGGYYDKSHHRIVKEKVNEVFAFASNKDFKKYKPVLLRKAKTWARKWGQQSLGLELNNHLFYIKRKINR